MCSPTLKSESCAGAGRIDDASKAAFVWVEPTVATAKARTSAAMQGTFMPVKTAMAQNGYRKRQNPKDTEDLESGSCFFPLRNSSHLFETTEENGIDTLMPL
jgi:hypothetical protein